MTVENKSWPLIPERKEGDAHCKSQSKTEYIQSTVPAIPVGNAAPTSNPSGAAPVPRPLEQEQWTVIHYPPRRAANWAIFEGAKCILRGLIKSDATALCDAHNTSLRALQEELALANRTTDCYVEAFQTQSVLHTKFARLYESALAACKAKDEALKACNPAVIWDKARMFYQDGESDIIRQWHHSNCELQKAALALQPDSSVKPEHTLGEKEPTKAEDARPTEVPYEGDRVP